MQQSRLAIRLFTYENYSAPWRVSILLKLKQLRYQPFYVNLPRAEQLTGMYSQINPFQTVPTLEINGQLLNETMAIAEYLEEEFSRNNLFPKDILQKSIVRQMCETVNSGIHPYHASRFYKFIHNYVNDINRSEISEPFLKRGLTALNAMIEKHGGQYSFGDQITVADAFVYPAVRGDDVAYLVDLEKYPAIKRVVENLDNVQEFAYQYPDHLG